MLYTADNGGVSSGLKRLLAYYRIPEPSFPPELSGKELVDYLNENTSLILIPAALEEGWYRKLSCPMLTWDREGLCRVVFPGGLGRAYFYNANSGHRVYVSRNNGSGFRREGYVVQRDLPGEIPALRGAAGLLLRRMGGPELGLFFLWSLLGGGLLALLSALVKSMVAGAVLHAGLSNVPGYLAELAGLAVAGLFMLDIGICMARRMSRRAALGLLSALGERVWLAAPRQDFVQQAAALAELRRDGERLCLCALTLMCGAGMLIPAALALAPVSLRLAGAAVGTVLVLALAAAAVVWIWGKRPADSQDWAEYRWLEGRSGDVRFGVERPFPFGRRALVRRDHRMGWSFALLLSLVFLAGTWERLPLTELLYGTMLFFPVILPLSALGRAAQTGEALARLRTLLPQAKRYRRDRRELPDMDSPLELKNVTFTYPGRREPVLRDIELLITPGEVLGILGGTGAGKTTLAKLMTGLLEPDRGMVYYGGTQLERYAPESVRRRIALEKGTDIRLLDHAPDSLDGRTTVIFSAHEEELDCCGRICELVDGRLKVREKTVRTGLKGRQGKETLA